MPVEVTQAHREAAVVLLYGDNWGRSTAAAPARFAGTGAGGDRERHVSLERAAQAIAKARAEGFAAGREAAERDVVAFWLVLRMLRRLRSSGRLGRCRRGCGS
jgi:hypothetical protein